MHYQFFYVTALRGLLIKADEPIETAVAHLGGSLTYTADWNAIPEILDIKRAVGGQLMGGLRGCAPSYAQRQRALTESVHTTRAERAKGPQGMLLIFSALGDVPDFELEHVVDDENFAVSLGDSPMQDVKRRYEPYMQSLLTALRIASPVEIAVGHIMTDVVFFGSRGKPIFFYKLTASATAHTLMPMTKSIAEEAGRLASRLGKADRYDDVARLLGKAMRLKSDPLHAFLAAWSALEILVNKVFKVYEVRFLGPAAATSMSLHPDVLKRMRDVMSGKFRLSDKFAMIAAALHQQGCAEDIRLFRSVKKVRDAMLHGGETDPMRLPYQDALTLATKYLRLHLHSS